MPRIHSREFKLDLCRRISLGQTTLSRACREHGLSAGMVDRWVRQFGAKGEEAFTGQPWRAVALDAAQRADELEEELRKTKLEVKLLRQMLDQKKSPNPSGSA